MAAIAAYWRTFSVPLLFDDLPSIADNASIRHWSSALVPAFNTSTSGRPILNLSLALNYALGGLAPGSYHAVNLAIHVLAGLTLFGILRRTLDPHLEAAATPMAFGAALIWTLHPLQTESVTYVIQRAESLMGLFYLLTLYTFIRGAQASPAPPVATDLAAERYRARRWFAASISTCLLGMGTKEVMVSAPLLVLCYDRTFLAGSFAAAWRMRGKVYGGLFATWLVLPPLVYSTHGRGGTGGFDVGVGEGQYLLTQFPAIAHYLRLCLWPHPLIFDYGTQWVRHPGAVLPAAVLVIGLAICAIWAFFSAALPARAAGLAGVWFFAVLAPTSLVPSNRQTAAEHRLYLALIPLVVLGVIALHRRTGRAALPLCLGVAAAFGGLTWRRNATYRTALSLWTDTVIHCPENPFAHNNLGCELEKVPGCRPAAIAQFRAALRLNPEFAEVHNNLGHALNAEGRTAEAISEFQTALREAPDYAEAHDNLGNALATQPGRLDDAVAQYEAAVRLKPQSAQMHSNLGSALDRLPGRTSDAIAQYHAALQLDPDSAPAHNNLGEALAKLPAHQNEAIQEYRAALRLDPGFAEAHNNLGCALKAAGRGPQAVAELASALRCKPDYAEAHDNLGDALMDQPGRLTGAIAEYREALRLKPDFPAAHYGLGNALNAAGRPLDALPEYAAAVRLAPNSVAAHNNLANTLNGLGRFEEAAAEYAEALRLQPNSPAVHFNFALALLRLPGRTEEAVAHLQEVLRLQPGNGAARQILAQLQ